MYGGGVERLFDIDKAEQFINRPITLGEIGCTLSHIECWKKIAENDRLQDSDFAVIAEDDVVLCPNFARYCVKIAQACQGFSTHLVILHRLKISGRKIVLPFNELKIGNEQITVNFLEKESQDNVVGCGSALYLMRKAVAKALIQQLEETQTKPSWLADQFRLFLRQSAIAYTDYLLGEIPYHAQDSDLATEREIAVGNMFGGRCL